MTENENEQGITEIPVGDKIINLKKPINEEEAKALQQELTDAETLGGQYKLPTSFNEDQVQIESIVFNNGKKDITETDKELNRLNEENKLMKARTDDSYSKIDELNNKITELAAKLNQSVEPLQPKETIKPSEPSNKLPETEAKVSQTDSGSNDSNDNENSNDDDDSEEGDDGSNDSKDKESNTEE